MLFWLEYTSGKPYSFGRGNQLITNLKKKPSSSNQYELNYKSKAINDCSTFFRAAINANGWLVPRLFPLRDQKSSVTPTTMTACHGSSLE